MVSTLGQAFVVSHFAGAAADKELQQWGFLMAGSLQFPSLSRPAMASPHSHGPLIYLFLHFFAFFKNKNISLIIYISNSQVWVNLQISKSGPQ